MPTLSSPPERFMACVCQIASNAIDEPALKASVLQHKRTVLLKATAEQATCSDLV